MTNVERQAVDFIHAAESTLCYLVGRWADEKEYEDIEDYKKPLETIAEKFGVEIRKMVKKPFGFLFSIADEDFQISIGLRGNYKLVHKKQGGVI